MPPIVPSDNEQPSAQRSSLNRTLQIVIGIGLAIALLAWALPFFAHTTWADVWGVLRQIPWPTLVGLFALMVGGLWLYTFTITGSLPPLAHYKAFIVNVSGSSVGNLLPGGGAAGVAVTYTQLRSWGFSRRDISTSIIVTGVWNVLARLALPVLGIIVMITEAGRLNPIVLNVALTGALGGLFVLGVFIAVLASDRAAAITGETLERLTRPLRERRRERKAAKRGVPVSSMRPLARVDALVEDLRSRTKNVVRNGWVRMTFGMVGFFGMFYLLFWFCFNTVGVQFPFAYMFFAYTLSRLLTAVAVTPGGLGVTETAVATLMVGWGADPAQATAGVVLFSLFTNFLEVPLGALGWLAWWILPKPGLQLGVRDSQPA